MDVVITFQDGEVHRLYDVALEEGIGQVVIRESKGEWTIVPLSNNVKYIDVRESQ